MLHQTRSKTFCFVKIHRLLKNELTRLKKSDVFCACLFISLFCFHALTNFLARVYFPFPDLTRYHTNNNIQTNKPAHTPTIPQAKSTRYCLPVLYLTSPVEIDPYNIKKMAIKKTKENKTRRTRRHVMSSDPTKTCNDKTYSH